jgi:hypothetical protein
MAQWNTVDSCDAGRSALASGRHATVAILALIAAVPGFVVIWLMSVPLLLPAFSLAWLVNAGCVALLAGCLRAKRHTDHVNLWDVAGAYTFIGFAAGMISKPEQVLQLFGVAAPVQ